MLFQLRPLPQGALRREPLPQGALRWSLCRRGFAASEAPPFLSTKPTWAFLPWRRPRRFFLLVQSPFLPASTSTVSPLLTSARHAYRSSISATPPEPEVSAISQVCQPEVSGGGGGGCYIRSRTEAEICVNARLKSRSESLLMLSCVWYL